MENNINRNEPQKEYSVFSSKLRLLLDEQGKTQKALAEYVQSKSGESITRQSVGQWCLGKTCPPLKTVPIIAEFFNVSTDYLLCENAPRPIEPTISAVIKYTGLAPETIEFFHKIKLKGENDKKSADTTDALFDTINALFCSAESKSFLKFLTAYRHSSRTRVKMTIEDSSGEADKKPIVLNSSDKDFENITLLKLLEFIKNLKLNHNKCQNNFFYYYYYDNEQQEGDENNG